MDTRTSMGAGPGWAALADAYTGLVADKIGEERGIIVDVFPGAGAGAGAPGFYAPMQAKIALEGSILPSSPELLDTSKEDHFKALAAMHGVFVHEVGHAVHTHDGLFAACQGSPDESETMILLEELRMEAQTVRRDPKAQRWLRACARQLIATAEAAVELQNSEERAAAVAASLVMGRVYAGSLKDKDADDVKAIVQQKLDPAVLAELEKVWDRVCQIDDGDYDSLQREAEHFNRMFPADGEGDGAALLAAGLGAAMQGSGDGAADEASDELSEDGQGSILDNMADEAKGEGKGGQGGSINIGSPQKGMGVGTGGNLMTNLRNPTGKEKMTRNQLAMRLRKVRWRDRVKRRVPVVAPPGRLKTQQAMQQAAAISQGRMVTSKPWRKTKWQSVEQPRLRVGVLCDTSGSMGYNTEAVASALWIIAGAVNDVQGEAVGYGFGNSLTELLEHRKVPRQVLDFPATGGTSFIYEAIKSADEDLRYEDADGPRLLIVITDGDWDDRGRNGGSANEYLRNLIGHGVGVLMVGIGTHATNHPATEAVKINTADEVAKVIGEACIRALRSA
jgi:hypothetical protein